jgi:hypothetical protein
MTVSANGATTTRTTGATAIGMYNIPAANDDDDDFKPSPPAHLRPPSPVVACLHPLRSLSLFLYGTNTGITSVVDDVDDFKLEFVMHSTLVMLSMSSNF